MLISLYRVDLVTVYIFLATLSFQPLDWPPHCSACWKMKRLNPLSCLKKRLLSITSELLQCINNNAPALTCSVFIYAGNMPLKSPSSCFRGVAFPSYFSVRTKFTNLLTERKIQLWVESSRTMPMGPSFSFRGEGVLQGLAPCLHQGWNRSLAVLPWDLPTPLPSEAGVCQLLPAALLC